MRYWFLSLLVIALATMAYARARFAPKAEMVLEADAIAIVQITEVSEANEKGRTWTYRQKASAKVENVLKGELTENVSLHGDENFICAQVHFAPGRYLVFLRRDGDLWAGSNWYLSVRPIVDENVDWYADEKGTALKPASLSDVLRGHSEDT